jgi:hypothetical protein
VRSAFDLICFQRCGELKVYTLVKTASFLDGRFQVGASRMPFGQALIESRAGFSAGLSDLIEFESAHDYIGDRTVFTVRKPVDKIMGLALRAKSRGLAVDNSFLT